MNTYAEKDPSLSQLRLILIEDNDADALLLDVIARDVSIQLSIQRFRTAIEAIVHLPTALATAPNGVMLDHHLPGGDGLKVLRAIRANPIGRDVPVIVMTSSISSEEHAKAEALGIQHVIVKAGNYDDYFAALSPVLKSMTSQQLIS